MVDLIDRLEEAVQWGDIPYSLIHEAIARIAALEAQNKLWQQNMREAYEAFSAMRNDLNELFPMQSAEADLLSGPEWSVSCEVIVDAANTRIAALEAQLAEVREKAEKSVMVCPQCEGEGSYADGVDDSAVTTECTRCGGNGWIVDLSALEATPPTPKVTEAAMDDAAVAALVALARHNIPTDIQELLVRGDPMRSIPPGALSKSFAAALKALTAAQESGE